MARIIAQELTEANRQVNNAPPCSWSERDVPLELKTAFAADQVPRPAEDAASIGYLTFSVFPGSFKTEAQREFLSALGCHHYQGYLFSRPLSIQEFEALVAGA